MDPFTGLVLAVLTAYATDKGQRLLDAAGRASFEKAKEIRTRLKAAWSGNPTVSQELESFEKEPKLYSAVIAQRLDTLIGEDPDLRKELEALVEGIGPEMSVVQTISESVGVVGFRAEEMSSGKASVKQEIDGSENVIGAEVKKFG